MVSAQDMRQIPVVYRWKGERILIGHAAQLEAVYPPIRLVRRKVMKERCRLRSVGCALEEPPVRAQEGRWRLDLEPGR